MGVGGKYTMMACLYIKLSAIASDCSIIYQPDRGNALQLYNGHAKDVIIYLQYIGNKLPTAIILLS